MIIKGSRYSSSSETRNGETNVIAVPTTFSSKNYISVITESTQSFESLADVYLGNTSLYWKIADLNPEIMFPDFIPQGTVIKVPLS